MPALFGLHCAGHVVNSILQPGAAPQADEALLRRARQGASSSGGGGAGGAGPDGKQRARTQQGQQQKKKQKQRHRQGRPDGLPPRRWKQEQLMNLLRQHAQQAEAPLEPPP